MLHWSVKGNALSRYHLAKEIDIVNIYNLVMTGQNILTFPYWIINVALSIIVLHHCTLMILPMVLSLSLLIKNSFEFVPHVPINNMPALAQIVAWHQTGDKPFIVWTSFMMHIFITVLVSSAKGMAQAMVCWWCENCLTPKITCLLLQRQSICIWIHSHYEVHYNEKIPFTLSFPPIWN